MTVTNIHFADPVLLKVTVELSETQKELLNVRQSDLSSPNGVVNLAERFCVSHGLDTGKIQKPLEEHIKSNIKGYLERQQQQQNQSNQDLNSQTQQYQVQQQNLLSNTGNGSINGGGGSLSSTARPPLAASNNGNISTAAAPSTVLTNISSATANTNTNTTSNITSQQYQPSQGTQTTSVGAGVGIQAPTVTKLSKLLENLQSQAEAAAAQNGKGRTKIPASYTTPLSARGPGHLSARDLSQNKHLKYHNTPNFTQVQHNLNNTTTTTTAAAKQREQLTGYLEKKIKQSREDRSNVFARLHQDASEKAIRLDLHRKMVDDHVKMRANQSPRKETGNGKGLGANSALALTQTMDSARNHHERGDRGGGANTNGGQGKGTNSGSDTPPMSNSELSRLSIFGKNQHREKLYQDAREKRMRLLRKQQQQESQKQWEEQQHTYQPDIVRSQARVSGLNRPVHTQTTAMQRLREREIHREKINQHVNNNDQKIQYNRNNGGGNGPGGGGGGTTTSAQSQNSNKHSDNVGWGVRDGFCKSQRVLQKMDLIRQEKSEIELAECTFRPKIDKRKIMERRIQKFNITGDLHEHLYEDAKRREERLIEYSNLVSPEVTFQPDIGSNKFRPMMDDGSIDGFFNRLMNAKLAKDQVIQQYVNHGTNQDGSGNGVSEQEAIALNAKFLASREAEREREREKELTFQPRVGRGPNFVRNEEKKPIGEFLYEVGSYVNKLKKEIVETKLDLENQERSRPKIGEVSKHVFEESKNRRLKELFLLLSEDVSANSNNASKSSKRSSKDSNNKNNDQSVGPSTNVKDSLITLQSLDFSKVNPEYHDLLKPVHAYLVETESSLDYEGFCLTMNFIIEKSGVPCGHLFVQNYEVRGPGIANVTITGSQRNLNHMTNDKELLAHYQNNSNQVQKLQLSNQLNARSQSPTANLAVNSNKHFSFGDGYRPFDPQCTFQPTISNRSRSLGKVKGRQQYQQQGQGGPATIYDRLYDKDKREEFQKRMKMLEKQKIESEMRECTFAPMKGISARKLEAQRIASQERGGGNGVNTGNSQQQSQQNQQNSYMSMNNNNNISRTNSGNNTARSRSNGPKVVPINYNLDGSLNNTMSTSGFGGFAPPNRSAHLDSGVTNTATSKAIQQVESVLAESQQQVARSKEIVDSLVNHHDSDFRVEADNSRRLKSAQMLTKKIENTMAVNSSSSTNGAMSSNGLNGTSAEIQMNQNQMSMTLKNQQIQNQNLNLNNTPDATQFESPRGGAYNSISPEQSPARQSTQGGGMNSARKSRPPSMGQ